jgi:hypothetical protein
MLTVHMAMFIYVCRPFLLTVVQFRIVGMTNVLIYCFPTVSFQISDFVSLTCCVCFLDLKLILTRSHVWMFYSDE